MLSMWAFGAVGSPLTLPAAWRTMDCVTTLAFDTLRAAKLLQQAGFDESQAEAVVTTVGDALTENVATKADLERVETTLKAEMAEVKAETAAVKADLERVETTLKAEMAEVKAELKTEMAGVKAELKTEMAELRAEFKTDLAGVKTGLGDLEARLYRQLWMMAAGIVGLTVALVKLLL